MQEGALSRNLFIQLDGSFLFLRHLWKLEEISMLSITGSSPGSSLKQPLVWTLLNYAKQLKDAVTNNAPPSADSEVNLEPFHDRIRADLWYFVRDSLMMDQHENYAAGPVSTCQKQRHQSNVLRNHRPIEQSDLLGLINFCSRGVLLNPMTFHLY